MKLAILDRVGLLHRDGENSLAELNNWAPQDGVLDAIAQLNREGWLVLIANNQPGLGRGSVDVGALNRAHLRVHRALMAAGAKVEAVFFCPHVPDDGCTCRAPAPGLLQQIATRYGAEPQEIWVIAREPQYLQAGQALGAHLVQLGAVDEAPVGAALLTAPVARYTSWQALANALAPDTQAASSMAAATDAGAPH